MTLELVNFFRVAANQLAQRISSLELTMNLQAKLAINLILMIASSHISVSTAQAQSGAAMLRIDCSGNNLNSEVYIDGVFRGECPVDIQVQEGIRKLRFYKKVDQRFERVQEQELRVGAATIKRIEILLPDAQLTAKAKREEEERKVAQELAAKADRERAVRAEVDRKNQLELQLREEHVRAEAGDMHAQYSLARRYLRGDGVARDREKGRSWERKAAEAGHLLSQMMLYQKFTEEQLPNVGKLVDLLARHYEASNLKFEKRSSLSEYLREPFFLQKHIIRNDYVHSELHLGGLIAKSYTSFDVGLIFNSPLFTVELKAINFVIGVLGNAATDQDIFGFSIDEEFINLETKRTGLMNRILVCAKVPSAEPAKYEAWFPMVSQYKANYSALPYHCLRRVGVKGSPEVTSFSTNWASKSAIFTTQADDTFRFFYRNSTQ